MNAQTAKITPGPWGLETVETSCGSCHKIGPFPPDRMGRETHACVYADGIRIGIDESTPRAKELAANARLIAAAPELLEAARNMEAVLRRIQDTLARYSTDGELQDPLETVNALLGIAEHKDVLAKQVQAGRAIQRATGEQP